LAQFAHQEGWIVHGLKVNNEPVIGGVFFLPQGFFCQATKKDKKQVGKSRNAPARYLVRQTLA
jgi:hypothetical protein